jgi:hypothetical protein
MSRRLILLAQALITLGCNGPSSRDEHVISDGGAASDCGVDATTTAMSGACGSGDVGSGGGSGSGSGSASLDPQACASCLVAHVPIAQACGDVQPDQLEAAATACGAASYAALGSGNLACGRSLAWSTVYGTGVSDSALAVSGACTVQSAGAGSAACLGAVGVVSTATGYAQSLIDLLHGCAATVGPSCVLTRDLRDKLMIARAAITTFRGALPSLLATRSLVDWTGTVALGPVPDALLRVRFPTATVGTALDGVAGDLQAQVDALNAALVGACF